MATVTTDFSAAPVLDGILKSARKRSNIPLRPNGIFVLKGTRTVSSFTNFTGAGDEIELLAFPSKYNVYLLGYTVDIPVMDEHATPAIVLDVELDDGTTTLVLNDGSATSSTVGQTAGTIEYVSNGLGGSAEFILDTDAWDAGLLQNVSGYTLQLACTTPAATDPTSAITIVFKVAVYVGDVVELGTSAD